MSNVVNLFKETDSELALKNEERDLLDFEQLNHHNFDSAEEHLTAVALKLGDFLRLGRDVRVMPLTTNNEVTGYLLSKTMKNSPLEVVVTVNVYPVDYVAEGEEC